MRRLLPLLGCALLAGCGSPSSSLPDDDGAFDAERAFRDLRAQVEIGPRPSGSGASREEVRFIVARLREAGVRDVRVQRPHLNVVARIPGDQPGTVVAGAHHDTKDIPRFVGANDGASEVALLLELARGLPARLAGPAIDLVFFDAEEARGDQPFELDGARGSRQFVRYARRGGIGGSPPLEEVRAMVLFDLVGDCDLQVPREAYSDPGLYRMFTEAAEDTTGSWAPFIGTTGPILDDHGPFLDAGIRAVDLIDLAYGPGPPPGGWFHTRKDNLRHVCADSLDAVGEPALVALQRIR
jgi:glutaminyl-peptide cyclotransferase